MLHRPTMAFSVGGILLAFWLIWRSNGEYDNRGISDSDFHANMAARAEESKDFGLVLQYLLPGLLREEMTLEQASAELETYCRTSYVTYLRFLPLYENEPTDQLRIAANLLRHLEEEFQDQTPHQHLQLKKLHDQFQEMRRRYLGMPNEEETTKPRT